jgi:hypothetical protein
MITELIAFEKRNEISSNELIDVAEKVVTNFHKKQDGYVDMELIKESSGRLWKMIVHYQTMEDIEKVKINIPQSKVIKEFTQLVIPESMDVSFFEQQQKWI